MFLFVSNCIFSLLWLGCKWTGSPRNISWINSQWQVGQWPGGSNTASLVKSRNGYHWYQTELRLFRWQFCAQMTTISVANWYLNRGHLDDKSESKWKPFWWRIGTQTGFFFKVSTSQIILTSGKNCSAKNVINSIIQSDFFLFLCWTLLDDHFHWQYQIVDPEQWVCCGTCS